MKKILFFSFMAAGFLFFNAQAHAVTALELAGSDYKVYMYCLDTVGDYCDEQKIKSDTFSFSDEDFSIKYFEGDYWGLAGNGDYSSSGSTFDASYTATKDISLSGITKYSFKISGFVLLENYILGEMYIQYKENKLLGEDTEEKGTAFFLGFKD
jgi:hypothetical protein